MKPTERDTALLALDNQNNSMSSVDNQVNMKMYTRAIIISLLGTIIFLIGFGGGATAQADAYIGNLSNSTWLLREHHLDNLKVAAPTPLGSNHNDMGGRKDWSQRASIISKGLATTNPAEHNAIKNRWLTTDKTETDYMLIGQLLVLAGAFILIVFVWNRMLRRQGRKRTVELELANNELIRSEKLARTLLNANVDLTQLLDEDGIILDANDSKAGRLGGAREKMIGTCVFDNWAPEIAEKRKNMFKQTLAEGKPVHFVDRYDPELVFETSIYPIAAPEGEKRQAVIVAHEITEREKFENDLQKNRDYLEHLINSIPDAVLSLKLPELTIQWARDSYNVLGQNLDGCIGKTSEWIYASDKEYSTIRKLINKGIQENKASLITESTARNSNGQTFPVEINITIFRDQGVPFSLTALFRDITERKLAEKALKESEEQLLDAQEMARVGSWQWDISENRIDWSPQVYKIYGVDPDISLTYESLRELIHPEDREYHDKTTAAWLKNRGGPPYEYRVVRPNGDICYIYGTGKVECDAAGEPVRFYGTLQDITDRKLAEETLRKGEERFRATFDQAAVGIAHVSNEGRFLRLNDRYCDIVGYGRAEMLELTCQDITYPDDLDSDLEQVNRLLNGEIKTYSMEKRYVRKEGDLVWVNLTVSLVRDEAGQPEWFVAVAQDITKKIEAEEALKENERVFYILFEYSGIGAALVSPDGHLLKSNSALQNFLGYSGEELSRMTFSEFTHPDDIDKDLSLFQEILENKRDKYEIEKRYVTKDGRIVSALLTGSVVRNEDGTIRYVIGMAQDITERIEVERQLRERETSLNEAQRVAKLGSWQWDLVSDENKWSENLCRMMGLNPEDPVPTHTEQASWYTPESLAELNKLVDRALKDGGDYHVEMTTTPPYGARIFSVRGETFRDSEGRIAGLRGVTLDITEQKEAEKTLRNSEARFRSYFNLPFQGIAITSPSKGWIEINDRFCSILGYDRDEFRYLTWAELTHPDDLAASLVEFDRALAGQTDSYSLVKRFIRKDGTVIWVHLDAGCVRTPDGEVDYFVAVVVDISESKKAEQALRKSEARFRATFDQAAVGIAHISTEGRFLRLNDRFCDIAGYSRAEMLELTFQGITYSDDLDADVEQVNRLLNGEIKTYSMEKRYVRKTGELVWVDLTVSLVRDPAGQPDWFVAVVQDISDRKKVEDDLRESEEKLLLVEQLEKAKEMAESANRAKSIFLANMSHELRTPLNAVLGFSSLLSRGENLVPEQKEKLSIINRSGRHLLNMIDDILDFSKIEAERIELKQEPFDLIALIEEIALMIRPRAMAKAIFLVMETESINTPHLKADAGKLRQILINLLNNAIKFTDEGGVTIRGFTRPAPGLSDQCDIVIEVEDSGMGIDPARQEAIFEPFLQNRDVPERHGTGLGLSISKRYAEFMGGSIEVQSEEGKGSAFRLRLPAIRAEAIEVNPPDTNKSRVIGLARPQKTWRILIADDNRENLLLLKTALEYIGFFVVEARNGKEAVALFKKESPDFIWMDMRMPVMDGYEATKTIRSLPGGEAVKIVAITASAFIEQRPDIIAAGCDEVVYKPFMEHEIFEMMGRFLEIDYLYEQESTSGPEQFSRTEIAAMLADVTPELLKELEQATLTLDREAALEIISRIAGQAPEIALGLKEMVDNFQMAELRDLLEKASAS
ncbi:PAS domain S-box protein [Desulfopila sp. IMCC35008]|uniref:PAS domain S-box protein n=1 Tax=Desulfopila sp. IMCC35008 TaxID=2653858 RepID=UPI0013D12220|nr:PAS domain S-box protein [Desulfopila sp. IMCC35008]